VSWFARERREGGPPRPRPADTAPAAVPFLAVRDCDFSIRERHQMSALSRNPFSGKSAGEAIGPEVTKRPDFTHKRTYQEHSGAGVAGNPPKEPLEWRGRLDRLLSGRDTTSLTAASCNSLFSLEY
jgi:hypothetical protein